MELKKYTQVFSFVVIFWIVLVPVQPQATEDIKSHLYLRVIFVLSAVRLGFKLETSCVFIFQNFSVDMKIFVTT